MRGEEGEGEDEADTSIDEEEKAAGESSAVTTEKVDVDALPEPVKFDCKSHPVLSIVRCFTSPSQIPSARMAPLQPPPSARARAVREEIHDPDAYPGSDAPACPE